VDKALDKEAEKRYQRAGHMALHIRMEIIKIEEISDKKKPMKYSRQLH
jgi:hypothetical protein